MLDYDRLFIGGDWVASVDSDVLVVRSPASGDVVGRVPLASAGDVEAAVVAARKAFDEGPWPRLSMVERAEALERFAKALAPLGPELDQLVPLESGIPICFQSGSSAFPLIDYYVDLARSYQVEEIRPGRPGGSGPAVIRHSPLGVVAGVVPWNGPVMQILMKAVPAMVAGCSMVVKTAPE